MADWFCRVIQPLDLLSFKELDFTFEMRQAAELGRDENHHDGQQRNENQGRHAVFTKLWAGSRGAVLPARMAAKVHGGLWAAASKVNNSGM